MNFMLDHVMHTEECVNEIYDTIEEELTDFRGEGWNIKRWSEEYNPGGQRGNTRRKTIIYHMLFFKKGRQGIDFRIQLNVLEEKASLDQYHPVVHTIKGRFSVHRASKISTAIASFLPYIFAIAGGLLGWLAYTVFNTSQDGNIWVWVLVPASVLTFMGARLKRNFSPVYSKIFKAEGFDVSDSVISSLEARAEPVITRVVKKWEEKDISFFPEQMSQRGYNDIDLDKPENLAIISFEQTRKGVDAAWRAFGLYLPERRKKYEVMQRKLRDDPEFYSLYKKAFEKLDSGGQGG
jgi:hypothetical protein